VITLIQQFIAFALELFTGQHELCDLCLSEPTESFVLHPKIMSLFQQVGEQLLKVFLCLSSSHRLLSVGHVSNMTPQLALLTKKSLEFANLTS